MRYKKGTELSNGILFGCNPQSQIKELIRQSERR